MGETVQHVRARLGSLDDPGRAALLQRYFKSGPGEYGEGDLFRGIRVPDLRRLSRQFRSLPSEEVAELLGSPFHEDRLLALLIMVEQYRKGSEEVRQAIYDRYLSSTAFINNWDLVDLSAGHIVGMHLLERERSPLYRLAASASLWERRIALMATFPFVRRGEYGDTLALVRLLLADRQELIHKAAGWMLREIGKRDSGTEDAFLLEHYRSMPRVMLRYAIERLPEARRRQYLKGEV
jgi:3-methyladenine DNA glycosylase AlkD